VEKKGLESVVESLTAEEDAEEDAP